MAQMPCHAFGQKTPFQGISGFSDNSGGSYPQERLDLRLLQKDVAGILNVDTMTVNNWEKNRCRPKLYLIPKIVEFLGYVPFPSKNEPTIREAIKAYRLMHGLSQKKMARALEIDPTTMARWETSRAQTNSETRKTSWSFHSWDNGAVGPDVTRTFQAKAWGLRPLAKHVMSGAASYKVKLSIDGELTWYTLGTGLNETSINWVFLANIKKNITNAIIKVIAYDGNNNKLAVVKSGIFSIDIMTITAPVASEIVPQYSTYNITLTVNGTSAPPDSVIVKYTLNNGKTWKTALGTLGESSFEWKVPAVPTPKYNAKGEGHTHV